MSISNFLKKLDSGEKDFLLVALAFVLVLIFIFVNGSIISKDKVNDLQIHLSYDNDNLEDFKMTELQASACKYAAKYDSCDKLNSTFIVITDLCCVKRGDCC